MKKTIELYGASLMLAFTETDTEALKREIYGLYNSGIVCEPPDDYDPETDTHVIVTTNKGRLRKAFQAQAEIKLLRDADYRRSIKGKPGSVFLTDASALAPKLAVEFLKSFERVESVYSANYGRQETMSPYKQGEIHDFGFHNFVSE